MIPKIIHYTWFSTESYPAIIQTCIESWHKYLPDYQFVLWDSHKIQEIESVWLRESLTERKWAFAADFVRLYAVYHEGGIYLDTDFLLKRSLDEMLSNKIFIGREHSFHLVGWETCNYLTSHCFGAEKGNQFIADCLHYYDERHFIQTSYRSLPQELKFDMTLLPYIQAKIARTYGYNWHVSQQTGQILDKGFRIYSEEYFDPKTETEQTFGVHLALGSWRESRIDHETITLKYKIKWRFVKVLQVILNRLGYLIVKQS